MQWLLRRSLRSTAQRFMNRRGMASGGHGHADASKYPHGMHFHVSPTHKNLALAYGTMLWLWIFYRAKQDGAAVLGLEHPWDHGHGGSHGGEGELEWKDTYYFERAEIGEAPALVKPDDEE